MTLESSLSKVVFTGNGVAVNFPFGFRVWSASQLEVVVMSPDGASMAATGWSATLTNGGGTVTYARNGAPLAVGWKLAILRRMPFVQGVDLVTGTRFDPEVVELQLDQATAERQQLLEKVNRAIVVPPGNPDPPELLAGQIFEARDQAAASAAAALVSGQNARASELGAQRLYENVLAEHASAVANIETARGGAVSDISAARGEAVADIASSRVNAVADVETARSSAVIDVQQNGQLQVNAVNTAGLAILTAAQDSTDRVIAEGSVQVALVKETGGTARVDLILEGDAQVSRVREEGASQSLRVHNEAQQANGAADRAEEAAQRAVDMTGVGFATKINAGLMVAGDGLIDNGNGLISVALPVLVSLPALSFPSTCAIGHVHELTMSAESAIPGSSLTEFEVYVDAGIKRVVPAVGNAAVASIMVEGLDLQVGNIVVVAVDNGGNRSKDAKITYVKRQVALRAPRVLAPLEGDDDVALKALVHIQAFESSGMPSAGTNTQLHIATLPDFVSTLVDTGEHFAYTTQYRVPTDLPDNTALYARARHKSDLYGWSAWGQVVSFTTVKKAVLTPRILAPVDNAADQPVDVSVVLTGLETTGIAPVPANTHVQIALATDTAFAAPVFDTGQQGAYGTSIKSAGLPVNTALLVRARHNDQELGWSAWSAVRRFTTINAYTLAPTISAPINNAVDVALQPTITLSAFSNAGPIDEATRTVIELSERQDFSTTHARYDGVYTTSWRVPTACRLFNQYWVRARHSGRTWGASAWSAVSTFKTLNTFIPAPALSGIVNGQLNVSTSPVVSIGPFAAVPANADTPLSFTWKWLAKGVQHEANSLPWPATGGQISVVNPLPVLSACAFEGYWTGTKLGIGQKVSLAFTTVNATLTPCRIVSPSSGAVNQSCRPTLKLSAPNPQNQTASVQVQVFASASATSAVYDFGVVPWRETFTVPIDLVRNTTYYIRVTTIGSVTGPAASHTMNLRTANALAGEYWLVTAATSWQPPVIGATYELLVVGGGGGGGNSSMLHFVNSGGYDYSGISGGGGGGGGAVCRATAKLFNPVQISIGAGGGPSASGQPSSVSSVLENGVQFVRTAPGGEGAVAIGGSSLATARPHGGNGGGLPNDSSLFASGGGGGGAGHSSIELMETEFGCFPGGNGGTGCTADGPKRFAGGVAPVVESYVEGERVPGGSGGSGLRAGYASSITTPASATPGKTRTLTDGKVLTHASGGAGGGWQGESEGGGGGVGLHFSSWPGDPWYGTGGKGAKGGYVPQAAGSGTSGCVFIILEAM